MKREEKSISSEYKHLIPQKIFEMDHHLNYGKSNL